MADEDATYELVMPFVLCQSNGGPYDDEAFAAGMACGQLWTELRVLQAHGATPRPRYVQPEHVPQLDLIAMHYGYTLKPGTIDEPSGFQRIDFGPDYTDTEA
ncbi:hypothetical protein [Streptomyces capuensis]|uniref:hypothetical protein n=1 Tax=Streptomyces capuensis TaxID=1464056 RepID=UPI0004BF1638|nr:hypothetical protein [Streptomyces capuensis]